MRSQGGKAPLEKYVGRYLKYLGPSQKTLRLSGVPRWLRACLTNLV